MPARVDDFVARLHQVGAQRYHDKHPFHQRLVAGSLRAEHIRAWVANRYYYQKAIPIKDAAILSRLPSAAHRRVWLRRIVDHDGTSADQGGTQLWLELARAVGLNEQELVCEGSVASGTRFAVDAYVTFARNRPWLESVASSLTELFAPPVVEHRIESIVKHYPWIDPAGLTYFKKRIPLARSDGEAALSWVIGGAKTRDEQDRCIDALQFKCDVLWSVLDATSLSCGFFQ